MGDQIGKMIEANDRLEWKSSRKVRHQFPHPKSILWDPSIQRLYNLLIISNLKDIIRDVPRWNC